MKKLRRKGLLVMLMFTLLTGICMSVLPVKAQSDTGKTVTKKNENFKVETEYGIDGWVVYETPVAANVTIECEENFVGTLRIIPDMSDYSSEKVAYAKDISLTAGEAKTFNIVMSAVSSYGTVKVELLDEKNKVVYGEKSQITMQSAGDRIAVGVLSDDYSALSYLDGIAFTVLQEQYSTSILELTKDSLPENSGALAPLQYIVIDNFDTAQLSQEQYDTLKEWTRNGGVLILGLGSNYQSVLNCFQDDFVSGTIGGLTKKDIAWKMPKNQLSDTESDEAAEGDETDENVSETDEDGEVSGVWSLSDVDCLEFELNDGEELVDFAEGKIAYQKNVGKGNVVVLSFALGMEPLISFEERENIAYSLLENTWVPATDDSLYGNSTAYYSYYDGYSIANVADENAKPNTILYAVILILYAVLVGPILYVILKAMKKREKIWVAVPMVAFVFTGIIYLTGFIYRINKPLVNTFSLITLEEGTASEKIYTSITCPKAEEYSVNIKDGYSGFKSSTNYYDYGMFGNGTDKDYDYMVKEVSTGIELTMNNSEAFEDTVFTVNKNNENNIGMLELDLHCYTTGFEGTVTNNTCYDLMGVVAVFENHAYYIDELKKGESASVDSKKLIEITQYDSLSSVYNNYADLYTNRDRYLKYKVTSMMENYIIDKDEYQQGCVWANIGSYKPDMIDGTDVKQSGIGVLYQTFIAEYEDVEGVYYPSIDPMVLSMQGDYDDYDRMMYGTDVLVTYSFEDYPGITTLTNLSTISEEQAKERYMQYADVYAFNPETGDYEQIFVDSETLSGEDLEKYISDDILMIKYVPAGSNYTNYMPKISAKGDE